MSTANGALPDLLPESGWLFRQVFVFKQSHDPTRV
jgi:hypothetical protein